jgi:tetratricopeptide (TPR) repeat protein
VEFRTVRAELASRRDWGSLDTIALSNLTALDAIIGDRDRVLSEAEKLETATIAPHDAMLLEPAIDAEIGFGTYARALAESKTLVELDTKRAAREGTPVESAPRYGDHLILWFGTAFVSGQFDEEERAFSNVARVVPWYPIVGYIRDGRFAEARKLADSFGEQALIDHGTWQLRYYAALAYKFTGRTDLAKQILDKMIADDSGRGADHIAVLVLRGSLADTSRDDRTAEATLREAVRSLSALPAGTVLPWELMPRVTLAGYEFGHEHYQLAVAAAREETSLHPDCIQALRLLYRSYTALGDVTHAGDIRKMISASVQWPMESATGSTPSP